MFLLFPWASSLYPSALLVPPLCPAYARPPPHTHTSAVIPALLAGLDGGEGQQGQALEGLRVILSVRPQLLAGEGGGGARVSAGRGGHMV